MIKGLRKYGLEEHWVVYRHVRDVKLLLDLEMILTCHSYLFKFRSGYLVCSFGVEKFKNEVICNCWSTGSSFVCYDV